MKFATRNANRPALPIGISDTTLGRIAAVAIFILVLVNVALISLQAASIPIRGFLAVALLGLLGVLRPGLLRAAVAQHGMVLLLAGLLAALGIFSSVISGGQPGVIVRAILEVHVQAVVLLLLGSVAARLAGGAMIVAAFIAALGVSAAVGLLQFAGLDAAWSLREVLGNIQGHDFGEDSSFQNGRPMGLSYSPIHLATQACLAFGAFAGLHYRQQAFRGALDWRLVLAVLLLVLVSFASATRSPMLGAVVFVGFVVIRRGNFLLILLGAAGLLALLVVGPEIIAAMEGAENRALRIGDNSSTGRLPLFTFGLRLFLDNPLGYGFDFVSQEYWSKYWGELYTLPSAGVIREAELHNYLFNMLNTYGIGLLLVLPLIARLLARARDLLLAFVPYVVHLAFHNSGPFWNDVLFWFVVGALANVAAPRAVDGPVADMRAHRAPPGFRIRARS